jgi:hypothetical protein
VRDAVVRLFMGDRADQRRLAVIPARALDARPFRRAAAPSVGTDQQAAREAAAIVERDRAAPSVSCATTFAPGMWVISGSAAIASSSARRR